jgi:predicted kinase
MKWDLTVKTNKMKKELFLLRGLPGSGKSTLAETLGGYHLEADMFFINDDGEYNFDPQQLPTAHMWCKNMVGELMGEGVERIVVSNTSTQLWEMEPYLTMAEENGYTVFSLIVENRHGGNNVHDVPSEAIERMKNRFEVQL